MKLLHPGFFYFFIAAKVYDHGRKLILALRSAGHLSFLGLDHFLNHIAPYTSVLFRSQVSVVSVCKRNA